MATFYGTNLADYLNGTSSADLIYGNAGKDTLRGNDGDDVIRAGTGNDILECGIGNDRLYAESGSNALFGGDGSDILVSGGGSDELFGSGGNDMLDGGAWINTLHGDSGIDAVAFDVATFADVDLGRGSSLSSRGVSNLHGIENIRVTSGEDFLTDSTAANRIEGMGGNDVIEGGEGDDLLIGGSGADTFVFDAIAFGWFGTPGHDSGHDVITDLETGDRIDLRGHFEATTFADLKARASQFGNDTVLRLGEDTIRLDGISLGELSSTMFLF